MNRIQRFQRFRLVSLALSLGTVLAVSGLAGVAPAMAASGDKIGFSPLGSTPAVYAAGGNGSTITLHLVTNTVTAMSGVQASVTFDQTMLQITTVTRPTTGAWANTPNAAGDEQTSIDAANGITGPSGASSAGLLGQLLAGFNNGTHNITGLQSFVDITFQVTNCPSGGSIPIGLPFGLGNQAVFLQGGTSGSGSYGAQIIPLAGDVTSATITCTPPAPNEFTIAASPNALSVGQGGTTSTLVSTTLTTGNAQTVALSVSGLPTGVTGTFLPTSITGTGTSTLTLVASGSATIGGPVTVTVTGTGTSATHTTTVALTVTAPPAGPTAAPQNVTVTGILDSGFLGLSVQSATSLYLNRNVTNTANVPVLIFSNTQWTLSVADAMLGGKLAPDRGHMLDTGATPTKRLAAPMTAYSPPTSALIRTLDVAGPQSLASGVNSVTQTVQLSQLTQPIDPPGNYAIDIQFSAISGF